MRDLAEQYLERFEVPGGAVAVVADGAVELLDAFGVSDLGSERPATTDTLFALASVTKAFTAAGVAALVDDGSVEWDRPVRDYLPDFVMHDAAATERLTPRDLLCHRSGLPRHDLLWYHNDGLTRQEIVHRLRYLQPSRDLRTTWQYNNLMYATVGHLCEVVSGEPWEEFLRERVLAPLGMKQTAFSPSEARRIGELSSPHALRDDELTVVPYAREEVGATGPAGCLYAPISDLARWLQVQLDGGLIDGSQVLSEAAVREMQSPQMVKRGEPVVPETRDTAYGLGWSIGHYRGRRLVHHGGNIDGFTSFVAFLPDDGVGIAVLTNRNATFVREALAYAVFDRVLELDEIDWAERLKSKEDAVVGSMRNAPKLRAQRPDAPPTHPLEDYTGVYEHPAYGRLEVTVDGDELAGSWHVGPVALTHRHYDVFDLTSEVMPDRSIELVFRTDFDGSIGAAALALEPNVDPIVFARQPEERLRDPEFLAELSGTYRSSGMDIVFELAGEHIEVRAPFLGTYRLEPVHGTIFRAADAPGVTARFELENGLPVGVVVLPLGAFDRATDRDPTA